MSYYQKYRPQKISELDLFSVRDSLQKMLASGGFAHAYLFVGPRGAGKTSTARILSRVINCENNENTLGEPCDKCNACLSILNGSAMDVIEMDAASHRSIDDVRDLREKIRLAPSVLRKKVYIIDEVHMLTNEAFNALLKTLEEPPAHALFFLCTTESNKVPDTIVSRCLRINFVKGNIDEVVASLQKAVAGEKLDIDIDSLKLIAAATDGSFREGHKLLEQVSSESRKITSEIVEKALGLAGKGVVSKLLEMAFAGDGEGVVKEFGNLENKGTKVNVLLSSLLSEAKVQLEKSLVDKYKFGLINNLIVKLIEAGDLAKYSPVPLLPVEMALLSVVVARGGQVKIESSGEIQKDGVLRSLPKPAPAMPVKKVETVEEKREELEVEPVASEFRTVCTDPAGLEKIKNEWLYFLDNFSPENKSLAGLLRSTQPLAKEEKQLTIEVYFPFHKSKLEEDAKRKVIEGEMAKHWGEMSLRFVLGERGSKTSFDNNLMPKTESVSNPVPSVDHQPAKATGSVEEIFGV